MKKSKKEFVCSSCGAVYPRWQGKCDSCGSWDSIIEEITKETLQTRETGGKGGQKIPLEGLDGKAEIIPRLLTNMKELDRTTGGGLVAGSVILIGGDPGIGKSTLLLQVTAAIASKAKCVYISGEESVDQVRLRAKRLGLEKTDVHLGASTTVRDIVKTLEEEKPQVVVIDSIQTMFSDLVDAAPGTVGQVRASSNELIRLAKRRNFVLFLVGHVTKEGTLAGPRVLEHMVDTVLYFEGDRGHQFRILRAVKNRFGATDEIGVFEMTEKGLAEVSNPSALFLAERRGNVSGGAVFAGIEGSRPILVEIQALIANNVSGYAPKRAVIGWDSNRLSMILAVLETRCGLSFAAKDIYLNVAGGLKVLEPAADLAVAAALVSGLFGKPTQADQVFFGEIGLSGEVRSVPQSGLRMKEAEKLGFKEVVLPRSRKEKAKMAIGINEIGHVAALVEEFKQE